MTFKPIRKAIFPVGGLGARFLPATKAMPKEMLPIVDRPLIQYAVEEAKAAGIEQFIFVTGRGKAAIEDHFDHSYELHATLTERGRTRKMLQQIGDSRVVRGDMVIDDDQADRSAARLPGLMGECLGNCRSAQRVVTSFLQRPQEQGPGPVRLHHDQHSRFRHIA